MNKTTQAMLGVSLLAGLLTSNTAQAYDSPPSWMPMTMTNVTLNTSVTPMPLSVMSQTAAGGQAQIPLALAGSYDPAKPWSVLNGTYYSRQLGWDKKPDFYTAYADHLPTAHYVYITQTGQTANGVSVAPGSVLKSYNATGMMGMDPSAFYAAYEPIFGTAGSSTTWKWDGFMDHNTYAVAISDLTVPNEVLTTTYRLYIGDASGVENTSFGATTTTWTWVGPAGVPEPTALSVLGLAAAAALRRRR